MLLKRLWTALDQRRGIGRWQERGRPELL